MSSLNIDNIMSRLPHRYPFLLIDRVLEMEKKIDQGAEERHF